MLNCEENITATKVTLADLQESMYQRFFHKYGKDFLQFLIANNTAKEMFIYLNSINALWDTGEYHVSRPKAFYIRLNNPHFTKDTSKLDFKKLLHSMIVNDLTFATIINLAIDVREEKRLICQLLDLDLFFKWVLSNFNTLLFTMGLGRVHNNAIYLTNNVFNSQQTSALISYLLVNYDKIKPIIEQNWHCLDLLFGFISDDVAKKNTASANDRLLIQKLTAEMLNIGHLNDQCYAELLFHVDNLHLTLPLSAISLLINWANNSANEYIFKAQSATDVDEFLGIIADTRFSNIKSNFEYFYNYQIDFNGYEEKVEDYKQSLRQTANIYPDCNVELDKLAIILKKG